MSERLPARPSMPFVPARHYDALITLLEQRGHDTAPLLARAGVSRDRLGADATYLTLDQVETIIRDAIAADDSSTLATELGRTLQIPTHGVVGLAGLTAPTLGAAIQVASDYLKVITPLFEITWGVEGPRVEGALRVVFQMDPVVEHMHVAAIVASLYVQGSFLLGGALPEGVELHSALDLDEAMLGWLDELGVRVHRFPASPGAAPLRLSGPSVLLDTKLPLADAKAHADALRRADALLAEAPRPDHHASEVARRLRDAGPPFPSLGAIARDMGTSERTLRRRLRSEGVSFRELVDRVRLGLGAMWLRDSRRSITEIAIALGYADSANFTRAFRRVYGETPTRHRGGA